MTLTWSNYYVYDPVLPMRKEIALVAFSSWECPACDWAATAPAGMPVEDYLEDHLWECRPLQESMRAVYPRLMANIVITSPVEGKNVGDPVTVKKDKAEWYVLHGYARYESDEESKDRLNATSVDAKHDPTLASNNPAPEGHGDIDVIATGAVVPPPAPETQVQAVEPERATDDLQAKDPNTERVEFEPAPETTVNQ